MDYEKLSSDRLGEPSRAVRARVEAARERQRARFQGTALTCNTDRSQPPCGTGPAEIRQYCQVDAAAQDLLKAATPALRAAQVCSRCTSARAYHRVLKLGRTLAGSEHIQTAHIAESTQYRLRRMV